MWAKIIKTLGLGAILEILFWVMRIIQKYAVRVLIIALFIAMFAATSLLIVNILDKFKPGGSLFASLPGAQTGVILSYIVPSNLDECILAILASYGLVMVYKYSSFFLRFLAEAD